MRYQLLFPTIILSIITISFYIIGNAFSDSGGSKKSSLGRGEDMEKNAILSTDELHVKFTLRGDVLHVIRGISLDIIKEESLAIVGESGSGKSVFCKTFLGMLDANGYIDEGHIYLRMDDGESDDNIVDLATFKTEADWLKIRGTQVAMVMQDPMTSLNPLKTIGKQIEETVLMHRHCSREELMREA
jgi:oligopeptide transport system ATP-binding protein